jgi:hypothetical protein
MTKFLSVNLWVGRVAFISSLFFVTAIIHSSLVTSGWSPGSSGMGVFSIVRPRKISLGVKRVEENTVAFNPLIRKGKMTVHIR